VLIVTTGGVLDTTSEKLGHIDGFFPDNPISSTNKIEMVLIVVLKAHNP
jgi:hypothetical protein